MGRRTFAERVANPDWPEFKKSVAAYSAMVDKLEKGSLPLPDKATAEQIAAHKSALVAAIRSARSGAKQGDIFSNALREDFVKVIRSETHGRDGKAAKQTIAEDNPNQPGNRAVPLAVNTVYPDGGASFDRPAYSASTVAFAAGHGGLPIRR